MMETLKERKCLPCEGGVKPLDAATAGGMLRQLHPDWRLAEDGKAHQPVMVHRALLGSLERFFGVLIEHYAGAFPLWLAPVQAAILQLAGNDPARWSSAPHEPT